MSVDGRNEEQIAWVLFVDIAGFSERVLSSANRVALFESYRSVVRAIADDRIRRSMTSMASAMLPDFVATTAQILEVAGEDTDGSIRAGLAALSQQAKVEASKYTTAETLRVWRERARIVSDSIFVVFDGNPDPHAGDPHTPAHVELVASTISSILWAAGLPHRGAIARGPCLLDFENSIFLGEPFVTAYRWEQTQAWLGISYHPDSVSAVTDNMRFGDKFGQEMEIPTKTGTTMTRVISPMSEFSIAGPMYQTRFFKAKRAEMERENPLLRSINAAFASLSEDALLPSPSAIIDGLRRSKESTRASGLSALVQRYEQTERIWEQLKVFERNNLVEQMAAW